MFHTGTHEEKGATWESWLPLTLVGFETLLVIMAMLPSPVWAIVLPGSSVQNGPFPAQLAPVITVIIYILPTIIAFLIRKWQRALLYATFPAWAGLGIFLIAASFREGSFYMVSADRIAANISVLELFIALGAIGWLGRYVFKLS